MTEIYDPELESIVKHHTLEKDPQRSMFHLSSGGVSDHYIDLRSAWLCKQCAWNFHAWYRREVSNIAECYGFDDDDVPFIVATGAYGAIALGYMTGAIYERAGRGVLWNPKGHGVLWSGTIPPRGSVVIIIDDVVSTGTTLEALRTACEREGWDVLGEIVPVRRVL